MKIYASSETLNDLINLATEYGGWIIYGGGLEWQLFSADWPIDDIQSYLPPGTYKCTPWASILPGTDSWAGAGAREITVLRS